MKEFLAIDYGKARSGLALASAELKVPVPYKVVPTDLLIKEVESLIKERDICKIIVGLPRTITKQDTAQTTTVRNFVEKLQGYVAVPVELFDEGLSTSLAGQLGTGSDDQAAALILEAYLESI